MASAEYETRETTPFEQERERRVKSADGETRGMAMAFAALVPLDRNSRQRALRWLKDALEDIEVPF
jgi:hypothetical protein